MHTRLIMVFLLVLLVVAAWFIAQVGDYYKYGGNMDYPLFIMTAKGFIHTGMLYPKPDDLASFYHPGAGVYKYPPAYQLTIIPWFSAGWAESLFYGLTRTLMLLMYLGTCALIASKLATQQASHTNKVVFGSSAVLLVLLFKPFHGTSGFCSEIYVLCLIGAAFLCSTQQRFMAGFYIGFAAGLKLYPGFMILYYLSKKDFRAIAGSVTSFSMLVIVSILYFGKNEVTFYFLKLLPVLLDEKTDVNNMANLNIGYILFKNGLIDQVNHGGFLLSKYAAIFIGIVLTVNSKNNDTEQQNILYGLFVCAMIMYLPNYWIQYQLVLLIPILIVIANLLQKPTRIKYGIALLLLVILLIPSSQISEFLVTRSMEKHNLTADTVIPLAIEQGVLPTLMTLSVTSVFFYLIDQLQAIIVYGLFISLLILLKKHLTNAPDPYR